MANFGVTQYFTLIITIAIFIVSKPTTLVVIVVVVDTRLQHMRQAIGFRSVLTSILYVRLRYLYVGAWLS